MHIITYASHIKLQQCNGSKVNQNDDFQQHREANTVNNYVSYEMRNFPSLGMMSNATPSIQAAARGAGWKDEWMY